MKLIVCGACGFMGKELLSLCDQNYRGAQIGGKVDIAGGDGICTSLSEVKNTADCTVVDFSHHTAIAALLESAVKRSLPCVIATTGHTDEEKALIMEASEHIPIFYSANFSLGVALLTKLVRTVSAFLPESEIEIVETHHNRKLDAPSGTALMLADAAAESRPDAAIHTGRTGRGKREANEIGIQSLRYGNIVGIHEVIFSTGNETITLKHEAHSRALFAQGAVVAAEFLSKQKPGLYDMKDLMAEETTS